MGYKADADTEVGQATAALVWATEVIYNEADGYYYAFFSASESGERIYLSYCARSKSPSGPFEIVSNAANESRQQTNYSQKTGDKYSLLNYDTLTTWFVNKVGGSVSSDFENHLRTIDFHPFVDPVSGNKYLYFKIQEAYNGKDVIVGVEMETWLKPKYDTLTLLAVASYTDTSCTTVNSYESGASTNEGAFVNYKDGIYYLTFSPYGYQNKKYAVLQAYSKHPLGWTDGVQPTNSKGDFRKLTPAEGGILVSSDSGNMYGVYATGHHAFIDINGKTYVLYHAYKKVDSSGTVTGSRYLMVDEVKWLTVKDKDGQDLQVMYVNGPTTCVMPNFAFNTDYTNVALGATVTATNVASGSSTKWLNDDLYKICTTSNAAFTAKYVQDAVFTDTTEITIDLGTYKTVRALMIYNSNDTSKAFDGIKKISMECKTANGIKFTAVLNDLKFDTANNFNPNTNELLPDASIIAEFDEMLVKTITITVEKPSNNEELAISEIVVLGKNK